MGHGRIVAALSGLAAGLAASACGALLGIDEVGYANGDGTAAQRGDGGSPPDGTTEGEAGGDARADVVSSDGGPAPTGCATPDAYFCADFDEGDIVYGKLRGVHVTMGSDVRSPAVTSLADAATSPPASLEVATRSLILGGAGRGQISMKLSELHSSFHLSTRIRYLAGNAANGAGHVEFLRFYLSNPGAEPRNCTIGYGGDDQSTGITAHCPNDIPHANGEFVSLTLPAAPSAWMTFRADIAFGPPLTVAFDNGVSAQTATYQYGPAAGDIEIFIGTVSNGPCDAVTVQYDDVVITTE